MSLVSVLLIILGLALFETVSSIDNAIINAQVLSTMGHKGRKWFLLWGILISVFLVRGLLPWMIVWATNPGLGFLGAFIATFNGDPSVKESIAKSSPLLLIAGGTFLLFLFFHWLFMEEKEYGLKVEKFFQTQGVWFYAVVSLLLTGIVWSSLQVDPSMALGAVIGSTAFFITHGFKENAQEQERTLFDKTKSDLSKIFFLEVIDATFSIDGVLGAFAFTLSVPLILLGNGLGAIVVRQLTVGNIDRIKKYKYLKNGAMYSILLLGTFMILNSFGLEIPSWFSPLSTFGIIGYFFLKSKQALS